MNVIVIFLVNQHNSEQMRNVTITKKQLSKNVKQKKNYVVEGQMESCWESLNVSSWLKFGDLCSK